jgi:Transposase DDE domain
VKRRLRVYAGAGQSRDQDGGDDPEAGQPASAADADGGRWRARLARACAEHVRLGPATLLLYDVTTLYFETDEGDGFREPGFSKERRLEPQITVGLLTDGSGFPLMVHAFEGNRAETTTMLPVLRAFLDTHGLSDVTVVADAGMVSEANKRAIEAAGLSFILSARIPEVPWVVDQWRKQHPDQDIADGQVFVQPWPAGPADKRRDHTIFYQYRADRARRTLRGIDEQIAKAENAVAGRTPVKRNRFIKLTGAQDRQPPDGGQSPRYRRVEGLCRCRGYAEDRLALPGDARVRGRLVGIITGFGARRSRDRRVGSRRWGRWAGGSGRARTV